MRALSEQGLRGLDSTETGRPNCALYDDKRPLIRDLPGVLQGVHDAGAGERLNIGVVVFASDATFLNCHLSGSYCRLSDAFAGFIGDQHKRVVVGFRTPLENLAGALQPANRSGQIRLPDLGRGSFVVGANQHPLWGGMKTCAVDAATEPYFSQKSYPIYNAFHSRLTGREPQPTNERPQGLEYK